MTVPGSHPSHHHPRPAARESGVENDRWPRDFGRDGVSGLVTAARAQRARDVSRPALEDTRDAERAIERLLSRLDGRR